MSRSQIALLGVLTIASPSIVDSGTAPVPAANTPPSIVIEAPADGGWLAPGAPLPFRVAVTDPEDGVVDCTKVVVAYQDGYSPAEATPGPDCTGELASPPAAGQDTYLTASYTDNGELTGSAEIVLHPREYQGPDYSVGTYSQNWFAFPRIDLAGINHLTVELATQQPGESLTVHADSPEGPVVASFANVPLTGDGGYQWFAADVADPVGVHDLYFVPVGSSVRLIRFQTVPQSTATVSPAAPASGWLTTDAAVAVGAVPLWQQQVSQDGGVTWAPADAPVVLTTEGAHEIQYRSVDAAGRTSAPGATTVRIDRTAPAVAAVVPQHGHSTVLELPAVTDAGSGVATGAVTLDGAPVTAPVELWRQPAGTHELTVTATDVAGNTTTSTTPLEITTSLPELTPLMTRFPMPFVKSVVLRFQLMAAQSAYDAGRVSEAVGWVNAFRASASALRDPAARDTLTADANLVIAQVPLAAN
jgi:hypothetical protein